MKILILGGGVDQVRFINGLRARGCRTLLADMDPRCPGAKLADDFYPVSTTDTKRICSLAAAEKVDRIGVVSSDRPLRTAAEAARFCGIPFLLTARQAEMVTNKILMKEVLKACGAATAEKQISADSDDAFNQVLNRIRFPVVVKPADSSASRGISLVSCSEDLSQALEKARLVSAAGQVIVETFLEGKELSIDAIVLNGVVHILMISEGRVSREEGSFGLYLNNTAPPRINDTDIEAIRFAIQKVASHLELQNSLLFFQMILDDTGPKVLEFSARNAGACKQLLILQATGLDVIEMQIRLLLGETIEINPRPPKNLLRLQFLYGKAGRIEQWHGFDQLQEEGILHWYQRFKDRDDSCRGAESGADRLGAFCFGEIDDSSLQIRLETILSQVSVRDSDGQDLIRRDLI